MRVFIVFLLIIPFLMGCQHSPKKNYYVLTALAGDVAPSTEKITKVIGIGPIEVAEYISRLHLIYQTDNNRLLMTDNDYWAEPLPKGIARVMALNLAHYQHQRGFVIFPWRRDSAPTHSIRIRIQQLEPSEGKVTINATWELIDNITGVKLETRNFIQSVTAKNSSVGLTEGYSQLLAELAKVINDALIKLPE